MQRHQQHRRPATDIAAPARPALCPYTATPVPRRVPLPMREGGSRDDYGSKRARDVGDNYGDISARGEGGVFFGEPIMYMEPYGEEAQGRINCRDRPA